MKIKILITIIICNLLIGCRYKENPFICIGTVKGRICGTWQVVDYIDKNDGTNLAEVYTTYKNCTVKISNGEGSTYISYNNFNNNNGQVFSLVDNKKYVSFGASGAKDAQIIKLTSKELWIEGADVFNTVGGNGLSNVLIKFKAI